MSAFAEASRAIRAAISAVRESDTVRNRAVLALAKHNSERVGCAWDQMPWDAQDPCETDQRHYVMHAMDEIDMLIEAGFIDGEVPPEAIAYREAERRHHEEMCGRKP